MATFVALLRGINVGGSGMLPMKYLSAMCVPLGFKNVRTYIQSGNIVFESTLPEENVRAALEQVLMKRMGKKVDVMIRSASELEAVLNGNPFPEAEPAKVIVVFLSHTLPKGILDNLSIPGGEEVRPGTREVYIHYPNGMGRSKLKLPSAVSAGTARNINTVTKLVAMTTG